MATLLGTPLGRPRSDPRNWGRIVVAVCGPFFGLLCASGFWSLVCVRIVVHNWFLHLSSTNQSTFCCHSNGVEFCSQSDADAWCSQSDGVDICSQSDGVDFQSQLDGVVICPVMVYADFCSQAHVSDV